MHIGPQHHQHADEAGEHDRVPECEAQDRAFTISPYLAYRKEPDHDVKDRAPDRHLRRHCENEDRHQIGQNQCNDSCNMSLHPSAGDQNQKRHDSDRRSDRRQCPIVERIIDLIPQVRSSRTLSPFAAAGRLRSAGRPDNGRSPPATGDGAWWPTSAMERVSLRTRQGSACKIWREPPERLAREIFCS